jgi:hypothetical protein
MPQQERKLQDPTSCEQWRIACHEAGHVVAAVRLKIPLSHVELGEDDCGEVSVAFSPIDDPERRLSQDEISHWQQFYAAGAAAERLLFGTYREHGVRVDMELHGRWEERRQAVRVGGWDCDIQAALGAIDRESVEEVAKALDRGKRLSSEQVYQLLGCKPPWE